MDEHPIIQARGITGEAITSSPGGRRMSRSTSPRLTPSYCRQDELGTLLSHSLDGAAQHAARRLPRIFSLFRLLTVQLLDIVLDLFVAFNYCLIATNRLLNR